MFGRKGAPRLYEVACLFVALMGIAPEKAIPKSSLPAATLPKATLLPSLLLPRVKLLLKIPPCTAALAHPSTPQVQLSNTAAMPATHALASKRSPSRFCFHFSFFIFLSPVGKCNETITRTEKKEVTSWLLKRREEC